jgi:phage repressor protein C with HTH and peptisase S24 domain
MLTDQQNKQEAQKTLAKNFSKALEEGKTTPGKIAEALHITEQAVSNWKRTGKIAKENLLVVSKLTGWSVEALMGLPEASNAADAPDLRSPILVPVVGHVKGGDDGYLEEMQFPVGSGEGYVEYWTRSQGAYALRIKGDSMHPRYRAGEFVVVTPYVEALPGQDVVVKLVNGKKLLKQLNWVREGELQLLSINNHYGPLTLSIAEVESIHRVAGSVPNDAFIEP